MNLNPEQAKRLADALLNDDADDDDPEWQPSQGPTVRGRPQPPVSAKRPDAKPSIPCRDGNDRRGEGRPA